MNIQTKFNECNCWALGLTFIYESYDSKPTIQYGNSLKLRIEKPKMSFSQFFKEVLLVKDSYIEDVLSIREPYPLLECTVLCTLCPYNPDDIICNVNPGYRGPNQVPSV